MTALLQVKGLTKRYGKLMALHDVSFDVGHGEIVGLIGPNGAGKTTLIGLLSGEIAASAGSVWFCGQSILGLRPYRIGELGIVRSFQLVQPFLHLTVRECVMLGALFGAAANRSGSIGAAGAAADALLERVGLQTKADTLAESLNIPERKKLEVARVMAARPKLLLLDEVMAGLTASEAGTIMTMLQHLRAGGMSIVVIEHMMHAIRDLSDRVIVLHHGRKIADGSLLEVLARDNVMTNYMGVAR